MIPSVVPDTMMKRRVRGGKNGDGRMTGTTVRSGLPTELPNDLPVLWRHGRSEDSRIRSKGRSPRSAQGEENGLFVGIGFSLEPNQLVDHKELGVVGLVRCKVAKPSVFRSKIMGEPAVA